MNANAYDLLALCMRYVFAALMVLILLRAWKITAVDWQRSRSLRRLSPETGIVGEFLVVDGHDRSRDGMHYPVILEGTIGSGRGCDIRLRSSSVRRRHAIFQMTDRGLFIRGHAGGRFLDGFGRSAKELTLKDGDYITIGSVRLMLILSDTANPHEVRSEHMHPREHTSSDDDSRTVFPGISRDNEYDPFAVDPYAHTHHRPTHAPQPARRPVTDDDDERYGDFGNDSEDEYDDDGTAGSSDPLNLSRRSRGNDGGRSDDVFYDYDEYDDC